MLESISNSVFDCPICLTRYNESKSPLTILEQNRPLTLPCGHVYCLECLEKLTKYSTSPSDMDDTVTLTETPAPYIECPQDKKVHHGDTRNLQCCYTILCNLPNGQSKGYSSFKNTSHNPPTTRKESKPRYVQCSRHPGKKVRYFCQSCTSFPCAECITDHSGAGHHFSSFLMTAEKKRKDFEQVYRQFKIYLEEARGETGSLESAKTRVSLDYEQEMRKLDTAYERAMSALKEQRKVYSQQLKQDFTRRKKKVEAEEGKLKRHVNNLERSFMDMRVYDKEGRVTELVDYERFYKLMSEKTAELKAVSVPRGMELEMLLKGKLTFKGILDSKGLERVKGCLFEFGEIVAGELERTLKKSPDSRFSKSTGKHDSDRYASQRGNKDTSSGKIAKICRRCYRPLKEEGFCGTCNETGERVSQAHKKKSGKRYDNVVHSPHDRRVSPYGFDQNSRFNQSKRSPPRGYSNQRKKQNTADKYARIYEEAQELKESGAMTHRGDFRESYFQKGASCMKQIPSDQCLKKGEEVLGGFLPPPPTMDKHKKHHRKGSSLAYYEPPNQYNVFESTILNRVIREQEKYEADVNQTAPYGDEEDLIMNNTLDEKPQMGEEEEGEVKGSKNSNKMHQIHAKPRSNPKLKHFMQQQANKRKKKANKNRARSLETPI